MRLALAVLIVGASVASGCGPDCQSTCRKVYSPQECSIKVPGVEDWTDSFDECTDRCEFALRRPGELDGYDPDSRINDGSSVTLDNEKQAAAWMDCVDETACDRLNDGYCPPI